MPGAVLCTTVRTNQSRLLIEVFISTFRMLQNNETALSFCRMLYNETRGGSTRINNLFSIMLAAQGEHTEHDTMLRKAYEMKRANDSMLVRWRALYDASQRPVSALMDTINAIHARQKKGLRMRLRGDM